MPNNTPVYWEADGVSLHTYARSITTLSGIGLPKFRGEDIVVPLKAGEVWVPKTLGANTITLQMFVRGIAEDGADIDGGATQAQYQSNWNDLIRALWKPGKLVTLRKRFYDGGILRQASALVEYAGGLEPTMIGKNAAKCMVDLKVHGGLFYHDTETAETLVNGNNPITVLGNAPTTRIKVTINGSRTNAKIINSTHGVEFTYPRAVNSGLNALIDVENYLITDTSVPGSDMSPHMIHDGYAQWLVLYPGVNVLNLSSSAGIGTVNLAYRAAWV